MVAGGGAGGDCGGTMLDCEKPDFTCLVPVECVDSCTDISMPLDNGCCPCTDGKIDLSTCGGGSSES